MTVLRLLLAAVALALSGAAVPAAAQAASYTFGADLATIPAVNTGPTCADAVPAYGVPPGMPSCMASYIGTYPDTLTAPATGTVNAIRVKIGATTGPMRVDVIRFLFRQNPGDPSHPTSAGPFLEAYGPQFTPAVNATTPVATSLAMQEDPTPAPTDGTTIQVIDVLALEIDAPNVPIPAVSDPAFGVVSYLSYPSPTQESLPAPSPNGIPGTLLTAGFSVLMSADLTTSSVFTPLPTTPPAVPPGGAPALTPPAAVPTVKLPTQTLQVKNNGATTIPIQCLVADCRGKLALQNVADTTHAAKKTTPRTKVYGTATFSAKAGKTASVKVKLDRSGRALLKHHHRATVYVKVTFTAGGGTPQSFRVTLKR